MAPPNPSPAPKDVLGDLQVRISNKLGGDKALVLDPVQWTSLFMALTTVIGDCIKKRLSRAGTKEEQLTAARANVAAAAKSPTVLNRLQLHRALVVELGRSQAKKIGQRFTDALFDTAKEATEEEVLAVIKDVTS